MIEDIEKIRKAIEIEIQYKYIDIHGKTQAFSSFIKNEAKKYYKLSKKNPKWALLVETFEHYPFAGVNERRKSIDRLFGHHLNPTECCLLVHGSIIRVGLPLQQA